jgi:hypothetical protein
MNQQARIRIIAEETAKFLDPSFSQLDLSSFPDLNHPTREEFAAEDKDGLNRVVVSGSNQLKALAENPDREALEQIAKETGDPGLVERLQDERENAEAKAFMAANPHYYRDDGNYEAIREYIDERGLAFDRQNLTTAYKALLRQGKLQVDPDTPRPLTERDSRAIALQAASGDVEGAVSRYLQLRLPQTASEIWMYSTSLQEALDGIAAPEYKRLVEEAVYFCWGHGRANYLPTRARRQFIQDYVAGRIPTARLLDEAWASCQAAEKDALRSTLFGQVTPQEPELERQPDLDGLSDEQTDKLYHGALRTNAVEAVRQRDPGGPRIGSSKRLSQRTARHFSASSLRQKTSSPSPLYPEWLAQA